MIRNKALLSIKRVGQHPAGLFIGAVMIILGFVLNQMYINIPGMEARADISYFPSRTEIAVTRAIVTGGFVIFSYAVSCLPGFQHRHERQQDAYDINENLRIISRVPIEGKNHEIYNS